MSQIFLTSDAPEEKLSFSLANETIEVSSSTPYETDDKDILTNARAHPWLEVKLTADEKKASKAVFIEPHVAREDDVLAYENSEARAAVKKSTKKPAAPADTSKADTSAPKTEG